jgi:hypothetical protein
MKIILTEEQFKLIENYIDEVRKAPSPEKLSVFFNDNPNAQFFSVIQRIKGGGDTEYDFKFEEINGHKMIKDINKGTKTKGCSTDARFDTMIYGNKFEVNFGKCGTLVINNVVGLKVFADEQSLRSGHQMDSYEVEHDLDKTSSDFIEQYYNELKNVQVDDDIHFDSKYKWDGIVQEKKEEYVVVSMKQATSKATNPIILKIDLQNNPFYEEDGFIMFKSQTDGKEFKIEVKKFFVDKDSGQKEEPKQEEPKQDTSEPVDPVKDAKKIMDAIVNDPMMKRAFYKQPSILNLISSAIKGEKPKGTGILPAKQIVQKYQTEKRNNNLGEYADYFNFNKPLEYKLLSKDIDFNLNNKYGQPIIYKYGEKYNANVNDDDFSSYLTLIDGKTDVKILIKSINEKERRNNTFNVTFQKDYTDEKTKKKATKKYDAVIEITSRKDTGYFNTKNKTDDKKETPKKVK